MICDAGYDGAGVRFFDSPFAWEAGMMKEMIRKLWDQAPAQ